MDKRLSQKVYDTIVNNIITGKYNQDTVITESELVRNLGVSRSPIREALALLCSEGILYSIPRFGYRLKITNRKYLDEIIQFRLIMETSYLDKYFDTITERDIESIENKMVTMERDEFATPSEYWEKTSLFHLELAYSYRDQYFYEMLERILDQHWITFSMLYWDNWSALVDSRLVNYHKGVLDAIKAGDKEKAIDVLTKDIMSF